MAAGVGSNDAAAIGENPAKGFSAHELAIKVAVKLSRDTISVGTKGFESRDYVRRREGLHPVHPAVPSGDVDDEQRVAEVPKGHTVAVDDVHVDLVQVTSALANGLAFWGVGDGGKVADGRRQFASVDEGCIGGGRSDVALGAEPATAKNAVQFEAVEGGPVLARRGNVVGAERRQGTGVEVE